jgi:hypothetical protein
MLPGNAWSRTRVPSASLGAFQTGDYEEIMNKATCLSLLSNAILVWNPCLQGWGSPKLKSEITR